MPVSIGFITPTLRPKRFRARASAAVTNVFPTEVSVPVTNTPAPRRVPLRGFIEREIGYHSSRLVRKHPSPVSDGRPFEPLHRARAAFEEHDLATPSCRGRRPLQVWYFA